MKKEVPVGLVIAAATVILGLLVFGTYKMFFTNPNDTPIKGAAAEKAYDQARATDRERFKKMRDVGSASVPR
jgi:hypothetical protein